MRLIERANALLNSALEADDQDYIRDLIRRLGSGNQPLLPDWFRTTELVRKYAKREQVALPAWIAVKKPTD